uniref:histidine kinase n=1 Tax=Magnetococcus massalia (strain MO-1) TaxID=451514 RepID=A0A1S7LJW7_MAGMO|nr:putative sensor histidine kinase with response regulator receiver domain [Candidatus Magnetococcus massalia]
MTEPKKNKLVFKKKAQSEPQAMDGAEPWLIGVVDDEPHLLEITRQVLQQFVFQGRPVRLVEGNSAKEAMQLVEAHPQMAVLLLDVVMESDHAGLDVVNHIRSKLNNQTLRILLRTGQAGLFPEEEVFEKYDINDYLDKAELTSHRLKTALKVACRSFGTMKKLESAYLREERLRQAAEETSKARSGFVASMGHELRSPTHSILSFTQMIKMDLEAAEMDADVKKNVLDYIDFSRASSERLVSLINNLLDLSKLEAGHMSFNFHKGPLSDPMSFAQQEMLPRLQERDLTLSMPENSQSITCCYDMGKVIQILVNLLSNAIKFSPEGGTITLRCEVLVDNVQITVADEGRGVPAEELDSIFDQYAQASSNMEQDGGTGLGLAICREIVYQHQGRIWAENRSEGSGAQFHFTLPLECPNPLLN